MVSGNSLVRSMASRTSPFWRPGLLAASAMNVASFEGMFSVFTRMTHQQTYDAILATPLQVDDIVAGETLWCASKSVLNTLPILLVAHAARRHPELDGAGSDPGIFPGGLLLCRPGHRGGVVCAQL